jgi:hypothetical protein
MKVPDRPLIALNFRPVKSVTLRFFTESVEEKISRPVKGLLELATLAVCWLETFVTQPVRMSDTVSRFRLHHLRRCCT